SIHRPIYLLNVNDNFSIFTATHSLDYYFTGVTPGIKTPEFTAVGCVDGLQGGFYDSNVKEVVLTADWIKDDDDVEHWTLQELEAQSFEDLYKFELPHLMKLFNQTGVRPKVFLYQRDSSEVVCHATGFFPKALMISWQKNGEDLHEDVDLRETLPNLDDTFQKKSILTVSPEELDKHNYTCIVQHISLEKEMVLQVNNHRAVTVLLVVVVIFVWKKKQPGKRRNASNFNMLKLSSDC
uniref:Ig-like domain-containing protein n=1 Tax=Pygocentrus nattereri TaxID=42514 RepID=A0A3B4E7D9_PYGNA